MILAQPLQSTNPIHIDFAQVLTLQNIAFLRLEILKGSLNLIKITFSANK